jgi:hypothetical protein
VLWVAAVPDDGLPQAQAITASTAMDRVCASQQGHRRFNRRGFRAAAADRTGIAQLLEATLCAEYQWTPASHRLPLEEGIPPGFTATSARP